MDQNLGAWGEDLAVKFLVRHGYRVLERNYRVWEGEIDVVAVFDDEIIFVEVKTRSSDRFGPPEESLIQKKKIRLYRAGCRFLEAQGMMDKAFRFDMIAIECSPAREINRFTHYEDIISVDGWGLCASNP